MVQPPTCKVQPYIALAWLLVKGVERLRVRGKAEGLVEGQVLKQTLWETAVPLDRCVKRLKHEDSLGVVNVRPAVDGRVDLAALDKVVPLFRAEVSIEKKLS